MPKNTKIRDIMIKDVAYATIPGSREEVLEILKDKQVSGVPVIKENKVVGIVSRNNLLKYPEEEQLALLMTRDPVTISPDVDITVAARLLLDHDVRRLPVVDGDQLVGLVTIADVVGSMADLNITDQIDMYLNGGLVPVWDETPLPVVAKIMEFSNVNVSPVLDKSLGFVGLISDRDIISASIIEDSVEVSDMSATAEDEDEWTWESIRDTMSIYYSVSRIKAPNVATSEIMVTDLITATPMSGVSECALSMKRHDIDQIPVINGNGDLLGLLRDRDLLKALLEH
ncbi:CBS domain containing protein [Methanohalobium evestigatum Z-7303]|uniref:CBS domain containing protein n=1 Tax=Methanohalobium evestigatum (strain ATCC BAA-1072 / DSM 3721 / NBRC 107634 / OCM 161 / Z-7303) TaxID=644295 RepID=D7E620_METEZ|nr:CBS domain-containing protein [Methanohalobium evestigatum]ADI73042.1 CBS domain containing protein [Methanohalobium evestigatum Z-7303]